MRAPCVRCPTTTTKGKVCKIRITPQGSAGLRAPILSSARPGRRRRRLAHRCALFGRTLLHIRVRELFAGCHALFNPPTARPPSAIHTSAAGQFSLLLVLLAAWVALHNPGVYLSRRRRGCTRPPMRTYALSLRCHPLCVFARVPAIVLRFRNELPRKHIAKRESAAIGRHGSPG